MAVDCPGVSVRYVDRWEPDQNKELFPELDSSSTFPKPHIVANLDIDRLSAVADETQDFVIASHVLEHLSNPLSQIEDIYRVLKPGGVALIFLPDRRRTFDSTRPPTPLEHLVAEHRDGVTEVTDAHIEDFLRNTGGWDDALTAAERAANFELHRQRSIHVHCWTQDEFLPVIQHTITGMGLRWELLDAIFVEEVPDSIEFGFVLRRATTAVEPSVLAAHVTFTWGALAGQAGAAARPMNRVQSAKSQSRRARLRRVPGFRFARAFVLWQRRLRHSSTTQPH